MRISSSSSQQIPSFAPASQADASQAVVNTSASQAPASGNVAWRPVYIDPHWANSRNSADEALMPKVTELLGKSLDRVKIARNHLQKKLSDYGNHVLRTLFGATNGTISPRRLDKIDKQLAATEHKIQTMVDNHGADIRFFGSGQPLQSDREASGLSYIDGDAQGYPQIGLSRGLVRDGSHDVIEKTLIHESSHSAAGTRDNWYLVNQRSAGNDMSVRQNGHNNASIHDKRSFNNRLHNADTIALAAMRLSEPEAVAADTPAATPSPAQVPPPATAFAQPDISAPPAPVGSSATSGPVRDLDAFTAFVKTHPSVEQFRATYPDVQLVPFGRGFTRETQVDQYVARINANDRIDFGYFANKV